MGLSLLFGNFCLRIVSKFMITGLILSVWRMKQYLFCSTYRKSNKVHVPYHNLTKFTKFQSKLILLSNHTLSHLDAVHVVDKSQHLQGMQEPSCRMILMCKLGKPTILN